MNERRQTGVVARNGMHCGRPTGSPLRRRVSLGIRCRGLPRADGPFRKRGRFDGGHIAARRIHREPEVVSGAEALKVHRFIDRLLAG